MKSRVLRLVWSNPNPPKPRPSAQQFDMVFIDEYAHIKEAEWKRWLDETIPKKGVDWTSSLF